MINKLNFVALLIVISFITACKKEAELPIICRIDKLSDPNRELLITYNDKGKVAQLKFSWVSDISSGVETQTFTYNGDKIVETVYSESGTNHSSQMKGNVFYTNNGNIEKVSWVGDNNRGNLETLYVYDAQNRIVSLEYRMQPFGLDSLTPYNRTEYDYTGSGNKVIYRLYRHTNTNSWGLSKELTYSYAETKNPLYFLSSYPIFYMSALGGVSLGHDINIYLENNVTETYNSTFGGYTYAFKYEYGKGGYPIKRTVIMEDGTEDNTQTLVYTCL